MNNAIERDQIGERVHILSGFPFASSEFSASQGVPLIRIRDLESPTTQVRFDGAYDKRYLISDGDILVGMDGDFNAVRWQGGPALLNQRVCKVLSINDELHQGFLFHSLQSNLDLIHQRTPQTTVRHLSTRDIGRIELPLIPFIEQQQVAEILDTADEAIRSTERLIAKLERVQQGLLRDLLTRGIEATGCLRGLSDGDLQPTSLGLIPLGWRVTALGDLGPQGAPVLRTGPFGSSLKGEDWIGSGVPVITIGSLGEGALDHDELLFISESKAAILDAYRVREGEIIFSRVADVGRSVVARHEHDGWVMSSNLMKITIDSWRSEPDYLQLALAYDPRVRKQLRSTVNSSGRDVVSGSIVKSLLIPLPPIEEQLQICARISQSRASIGVEVHLLAKLHLLKQGLMDDLLTGRVRVGTSG